MSNEQGFVSASDYEAWKREHEFIQRGAQEAVAQAGLARVKGIGAIGAAGTDTTRHPQDGPHGVMQNMAYGSSGAGMFKDRPLVDALSARLAEYCGEGGRNEGAVETLDRLLSEVRAARQGPTPPPPQEGPRGAILGQALGRGAAQMLRAPGKMFSRETITGVLRGRRADAEMDCPGSPRSNELAYLIRIFENLE